MSRSFSFSAPPYCSSSHTRYFSTVLRKSGHSTPHIKPRSFHRSLEDCTSPWVPSLICWSSQTIRFSARSTHFSQLCHTNGPASRSLGSKSMPSWSSLIRFAICFEVSGRRSSCGVSALALKNSSKRPLVNVPKSLGPIRLRASLRRIWSSASRSMRCSTWGP